MQRHKAKYEIYLCPQRKVPVCGDLVGGPHWLQVRPEVDLTWKEIAAGKLDDRGMYDHTLEGATLGELWQAENDELINLMPLILFFGCSPKEIKARVGKGIWKKLAANTKSRNYLIGSVADKSTRCDESGFDGRVRFLSGVESSVLKYFDGYDWMDEFTTGDIEAARHAAKLNRESLNRRVKTYRETFSLLSYEGRSCSPRWSDRRLK